MTVADVLAALQRTRAVLAEVEAALVQAQLDIDLYRQIAARAMAERDELRMALALRGGRAAA